MVEKKNILAKLRHMLACICHPVSTFEPVTHYCESWLCFIFRLWLKKNILAKLRHMLPCICHPVSTFEPVTHYCESWNEFYTNGRHPNIIHYFATFRNNGISDAWAIEVGVMPTTCLGRKIMCDKSWKYVQVLLRQYFCRIWNNSVMSVHKLYLACSFMSVTDESLKFGTWNLVQMLVINISTYYIYNVTCKSFACGIDIICKIFNTGSCRICNNFSTELKLTISES
jgi:hypothetical protein